MPTATSPAEHAIYTAAANLERALSGMTALRFSISRTTLPIAEAEACMDDIDDHINGAIAKLTAALKCITTHIDVLQLAGETGWRAANDNGARDTAVL